MPVFNRRPYRRLTIHVHFGDQPVFLAPEDRAEEKKSTSSGMAGWEAAL
jgi:hypothetical protein